MNGSNSCVICKSPLVLDPIKGAYQCQNAQCKMYGRAVQPCEICKTYSVSGSPAMCLNPTCAVHERPRDICPQCQSSTLLTVSGLQLCVNGRCPSNDNAPACWFCKKTTVSVVQHKSPLFACRNPECSAVMKLIRPCPVCVQHAFDLSQGRCLNSACPTKGARVRECPSCHRKRFFGSSSADKMCANSVCDLFIGDAALAQAAAKSSSASGFSMVAPPNPFGDEPDHPAIIAPTPPPPPKSALPTKPATSPLIHPTPSSPATKPPQRPAKPAAATTTPAVAQLSGSDDGDFGIDQTIALDADAMRQVQNLLKGGSSATPPAKPAAAKTPLPSAPSAATNGGEDEEFTSTLPMFRTPDFAAPREDAIGPANAPGATALSRPDLPKPVAPTLAVKRPLPPVESDDPAMTAKIDPGAAWNDAGWKPADVPSIGPSSSSEPERIESISKQIDDAEQGDTGDELGVVETSTVGGPVFAPPADPTSARAVPDLGTGPVLGGIESNTTTNIPAVDASHDDMELSEDEPAEINFQTAFEHLRRQFIQPKGQKPSPLYLVIGLAGVGKTCFLTMLGQVLLGGRFFSPREEIKPQMVKIDARYREYIRDLVYDFSSFRFDEYIANGLWPPADIPGQTSEFLITELLNADGDIARLATLEISGEIYQEFLPKVAEIYQDPATIDRLDANHRIIWELMQNAEGIVVLLEGSVDINTRTQMYGQFFQALYQWKSAQVRRTLRTWYEEFSELDEKDYPLILRTIIGGFRKKKRVSFEEFSAEVRRKSSQAVETLEEQGINELFIRHFRLFEELRILYGRVDPDNVPLQRLTNILESDPNYKDPNNQLQAFKAFLRGFLTKFTSDKHFLEQVYQKQNLGEEDLGEDDLRVFQRYVCWQYGLDESELQSFDLSQAISRADDEGSRPFDKLKYLAITFTKTDKDFAIYPASNFPKVVNVDWANPLPRLGNYLTLCNGYLKYYNASVAGYSARKDAGFLLGRRGTLTPINIAEPILDMLTFQGHPPLF